MQNLVNNMKKWFKSKIILTEDELKIKDIIAVMLLNKDTLIEINPDDMSYMLSDEANEYYVDVDSVGITVTNHKFYLDARLESGKIDIFKSMIKLETVVRRVQKRDRIFTNRLNLLDNIIDKLNGKY